MPYSIARIFVYLYALCFAGLLVYSGVGLEYMAPTVIALLIAPIIFYLLSGQLLQAFGKVGIWLLAFGLWATASVFWSLVPDATFVGLLRINLLPLGFFAISILLAQPFNANTRPIADLMRPLLRLMLVLVFIFSWFPSLDQIVAGHYVRSGGLLFDANLGANIINFAVIALLAMLIFIPLGKWQYAALLLAFFVSFLGFGFGSSRSAILGLTPSILLFAALGMRQLGFKAALKRAFWPTVAMLLALWMSADSHLGIYTRVSETLATGSDYAQGGRMTLWRGAWEWYLQHPWLGTGIYTFQELYQMVRVEPFERGFYAHNDYLQMLMELGPLGLILFVGVLCMHLYFIYRAARAMLADVHEHDHKILLALNLWLLAAFVQAGFYFDFYSALFMFGAGITLALSRAAYLPTTANPQQQRYTLLRPTISLILLLYIVSNFLDAFAARHADVFKRSLNLSLLHNMELFNVGKLYPKFTLAQAYYVIASAKIDKERQHSALDYSLDRLCQYLHGSAYNYMAMMLLADIYNRYEALQLPAKHCQPNLPQNKYTALERAIDLAPFATYGFYGRLMTWYAQTNQQTKLHRLNLKRIATSAILFDYAHNQSWQQAWRNAELNADYYQKYSETILAQKRAASATSDAQPKSRFFTTLFGDIKQ